jgi:phosphoribosylformylglycinamidine synthase I
MQQHEAFDGKLSMKSAVLVFPGINRERDMARAIRIICGTAPDMVWHAETELPAGTDLVIIPGGFSYGDYLRCGAIAARAPIMDAVRRHATGGGLVLGVCNGFQILCEAGLLPGVLMRNAALKFICKDVYLRIERSDTPFTRGYNAGQVIRVPTAHGEGNYVADEATVARLEAEGRVALRYVAPDGTRDPQWNVNGAASGKPCGSRDWPYRRARPVRRLGAAVRASLRRPDCAAWRPGSLAFT